jgi:hypothetical protein
MVEIITLILAVVALLALNFGSIVSGVDSRPGFADRQSALTARVRGPDR